MSLTTKRRRIEKVLADDKTPKEVKEKLQIAVKLREFIENDLNLEMGDCYTTYVDLERPWAVKTLMVSDKCSIAAYTWSFPILGKVPYLGFLKESSAIKKEKAFIAKDYDTYVRDAVAYSTLGWFADPILSSITQLRDHDFIATIIHETVHLNIFKKGDMEFNENIATFIEEEGTKRYLQKIDGIDSTLYKDYLISLERDKRKIVFLKGALQELQRFYQQHQDCRKIKDVREEKFREIEEDFHRVFNDKIKVNNAYMVNIALYHINYEDLLETYHGRFKGDIKAFVGHYRDKHGN